MTRPAPPPKSCKKLDTFPIILGSLPLAIALVILGIVARFSIASALVSPLETNKSMVSLYFLSFSCCWYSSQGMPSSTAVVGELLATSLAEPCSIFPPL